MVAENPYLALAAPAVGALTPYQPGKPVAELEREYGVSNAIKLASNENPHGPAPLVHAAIESTLHELARYPDGAGFELRAALSRHHRVAPEQITLGNGSNDILVLLAETFLTPATGAVFDQHGFIVYALAVQACGAIAQVTPSNPARSGQQPLGHDLAAMRARIDAHTRLVFIANPNNPTGTWVDDTALQAFLEDMPAHVIVVLDEAYADYAQAEGAADAVRWLERYPNLVVVRTFSKAYGLAGLRVGYSISHPAIAELLNRVRQPFNVNAVAQAAATAALAATDWTAECVADNRRQRERLRAGLESLGYPCLPSRGNFLLADFADSGNAARFNEYLLRNGIIVRPVGGYGLPAYLRISVGTAAEIECLLQRLQVYPDEAR